MDWSLVIIASLVGYLLGSISFARVIVRIVAPGEDVSTVPIGDEDSENPYQLEAVAGTAVAAKLGEKWGCLTAWFDIFKVLIPALVFKYAFPETPYFLLVAAFGIVGHNWPIYHKFKGGRGLSPTIGGYLVVDWVGTLVCALVSVVLGTAILKNVLIAYTGVVFLMIPWVWFRFQDPAYLAYVLFVNIIFFVAMIPDIKMMRERERLGIAGDFDSAMNATPMGRGLKKIGNLLPFRSDEPQTHED